MNFFRNTFIYFSASVLNRAIPFLLLPILTRYLKPAEYGYISMFQVYLSFFTAFVGLGLQITIGKFFHNLSRDEFKKYLGNNILLVCASSLLVFLTFAVAADFWSDLLDFPKTWVLILPVLVLFQSAYTYNLLIQQNNEKPVHFGLFEISQTVINVAISLYLIVYLGYNWEGRLIGISIAIVLMGMLSFLYLKKNNYVMFLPDRPVIKEILGLSLPAVPHYLSTFIISMSDRIFIDKMGDKAEVGLYSTGYNFGIIMMVVTDAIIRTWTPWFYKSIKEDDPGLNRKIVLYTYYYFIGTACIAIALVFVSKFVILYLLDSRYAEASKYVGWVTMGYMVRGYYQIFFPYLVQLSKTKFLGIITGFSAVINLPLNYILIDKFGAIGAAQATFISFFSCFLIMFFIVDKNIKMPWLQVLKIKK